MIIGISRIDLLILDSRSLKQKRYVLQRLKTQLRRKFNISIVETGKTELWQRCMLVVATVSNEVRHANRILSKVVQTIEGYRQVQLLDYSTEMR